MIWIALLLSVLFAGADPPRIEISLSRTACFGTCPEYSVRLTDDGTVTYNGRKFVRLDGVHTWKIDPAAVRALADDMVKDGFFDLQNSYTSRMTDHPTVYTTLLIDGRYKAVSDYITGPPELKAIERRIDIVAGTKRFVSIDGATIREMARTGWRATDEKALGWLWEAAYAGDADVLGALLDAGADPTAARDNGMTVLMAAAIGGDPGCVRRLLGAGADPTWRDGSGRNAADYVREAMKPEHVLLGIEPLPLRVVDATGRPPQYDLILKLLTNE